ncbi:MAG TPA: thioredoxin [Acidimicrobiales bacterium]
MVGTADTGGTRLSADVVTCLVCGRKNRVPKAASGIPRCGHCRSALPWITEADDVTFVDVVETSAIPVLVDFWATWCAPCRTVSPDLEQLARERAGLLKLVKVNVDQAPQLSSRFTVHAIPTLMLVDGGKVVSRRTGAAPGRVLGQWVDDEFELEPH